MGGPSFENELSVNRGSDFRWSRGTPTSSIQLDVALHKRSDQTLASD